MRYKVFDVIFGRKLKIAGNKYKLIDRERLTSSKEDGTELTLVNLVNIVKNIVKKSRIVSFDYTPDQVTGAINDFMNKDSEAILSGDLESFLGVIRSFGYDLYIVARPDLTESDDKLTDSAVFSYLVNNFQENNIGVSNFYIGTSKNYDGQRVPLAYDYLNDFALTSNDINRLGFENLEASFNILNSQNQLSGFDDESVQIYLLNRGYKFIVFYV